MLKRGTLSFQFFVTLDNFLSFIQEIGRSFRFDAQLG